LQVALYNALYSCFQNENISTFLLVLDVTNKAARKTGRFSLSNTEVDVEVQGRKSKLGFYSFHVFLDLFFLSQSLPISLHFFTFPTLLPSFVFSYLLL
jgi:hypothetical protein